MAMEKNPTPSQLNKRSSKATSPPIKTGKASPVAQTMPDPCPLGARRVWNKARPHKGVASTIAAFNDGGEKQYNQKPKFAPGVPNNKATRQGYVGPNEKVEISRGNTEGTYPGAETSYS